MQTQYNGLNYRTDLYFHDYNFAIEVNEYGHNGRNINYVIERQQTIEKELGCEFIRINTDEQNFNIFKAINRKTEILKNHLKNIFIDKISKRLSELEFLSNH